MLKEAEIATLTNVVPRFILRESSPLIIPETRISQLNREITHLADSLSATQSDGQSYFGFEGIEEGYNIKLLNLKHEGNHLEFEHKGFPELDYSFLSWCKKDSKLPAFSVLTLKTNWMRLWPKMVTMPILPSAIRKQFEEAANFLEKQSIIEQKPNLHIDSLPFHGLLPPKLRQKITTLINSNEFDSVFIIAETEWEMEKDSEKQMTKQSTLGKTHDPLVVGWIEETEQMFLIDSFDPTPLEDYIKEQYQK